MRQTARASRTAERAAERDRQIRQELQAQGERRAQLETTLTPRMSKEAFVRELISVYKTLRFVERVPEPMPIPTVKKRFCEKTGLTREQFDQFFEIIDLEGPTHRISLLVPEYRNSGGITLGGRYFHNMIVREEQKRYCHKCGQPLESGAAQCPSCKAKTGGFAP
ncbi:MAG: hypothetical protein HY558_00455 [Euryarchaeota archaeon]|nr:hypothetical protein [Euryarchaeota archaeon]